MSVPRRRRGAALRIVLRVAWLALAVAVPGCAGNGGEFAPVEFERPETTVAYEVTLEGAPSEEVTALAEESLAVYRYRDEDAASLAFLRRRAEGDIETLGKILSSRGYYSAEVEAAVEETGEDTAEVTFTIEPGPAFTLARHELAVTHEGDVAPPELDAGDLGSPVGEQARAAAIAAAEGAAVARLRRKGFAYAAPAPRRPPSRGRAESARAGPTPSARSPSRGPIRSRRTISGPICPGSPARRTTSRSCAASTSGSSPPSSSTPSR